MPDAKRQWKRSAQVVIGKGGDGVLVSSLRITFEVIKTVEHTPNGALIKIYNLSPQNEAKIKTEFDEVILNAGYQGAEKLVFRGTIKHVSRYREQSDYITEIEAGDGDRDFRNAVMNETLAAGTTNAQLVDRAVGSFKNLGGTTKGQVQINDRARLRGKVISGNTRDVLHDIARESGANWSIQDGQLVIVKVEGVLPNEAVVITAETGMLGTPEVNENGISLKCLMNPVLAVNGAIKLDNKDITLRRQKEQRLENDQSKQLRFDPDGIYKILKLTHKGDTRGQDWFSEVECIGLSQPIPEKKGAN